MKTSHDPRHLKRIRVMQDLFSWEFRPDSKLREPFTKEVVDKLTEIDKKIEIAATERPLSQINRIDLAILRLAIFELIMERSTPLKVVVDEAVELAKEFGSESSPNFVNGVLGKVIESHKLEKGEKDGK